MEKGQRGYKRNSDKDYKPGIKESQKTDKGLQKRYKHPNQVNDFQKATSANKEKARNEMLFLKASLNKMEENKMEKARNQPKLDS